MISGSLVQLAQVLCSYMNRTSVYKLVNERILQKHAKVHRGILPPLSSCGGEPGNTIHDLLEQVSSEMGTSPKAPFRFTQFSRSPSMWPLSPKGRQACLTLPGNQMHYCAHVRVNLGEGEVTTLSLPMPGVDY